MAIGVLDGLEFAGGSPPVGVGFQGPSTICRLDVVEGTWGSEPERLEGRSLGKLRSLGRLLERSVEPRVRQSGRVDRAVALELGPVERDDGLVLLPPLVLRPELARPAGSERHIDLPGIFPEDQMGEDVGGAVLLGVAAVDVPTGAGTARVGPTAGFGAGGVARGGQAGRGPPGPIQARIGQGG